MYSAGPQHVLNPSDQYGPSPLFKATSPTNLADLDMTRFAAARGMQDFTGDTVPAGRWAWKWHQRALSVQQKMSDLVECWLDLYTGGDEARSSRASGSLGGGADL